MLRSWKRMLVGAGIGLGVTSLALLVTTVMTFWIEFNEAEVALVAYVILIYGTVFGAVLGLLTRPATLRQRGRNDAETHPHAVGGTRADRELRLVGNSSPRREVQPEAGADGVLTEAYDAVARARLERAWSEERGA